MHSSYMRTAYSSRCPRGGGGSPTGHCYGLLVWWPSVMEFCPPQQKTTTEGHNSHNRRPQPLEQAPPPSWDQAPPPGADPPGDLLQGMLEYHLQCMLGYPYPPPPNREQNSWHMPMKILPWPKFCLFAGGNERKWAGGGVPAPPWIPGTTV